MMPTDIPPAILALHAEFERLTGAKLTLTWGRVDAWRVWQGFRKHAPFTAEDLRVVVAYFRRTRKGSMLDNSLRFKNLVEMADWFEEELALATQALRPRPPATALKAKAPRRGEGRGVKGVVRVSGAGRLLKGEMRLEYLRFPASQAIHLGATLVHHVFGRMNPAGGKPGICLKVGWLSDFQAFAFSCKASAMASRARRR